VSRRQFYLIGFGVLVLADTWTQMSFKLATHRTGEFLLNRTWLLAAAASPWIYGAVAGYLAAFITWMTLLKHAPIGPAFAASHLEVVTVLIVSVALFGEHLSPFKLAGATCIVLGIILLSRSESKHSHA
jgi:drug/metabolite transporter (DMT)-like permease